MFSQNALYSIGPKAKMLCLAPGGPGENIGALKAPKTITIAILFNGAGMSAAFFPAGKFIKTDPQISSKIISYGHINDHYTFSHPRLPQGNFEQKRGTASGLVATAKLGFTGIYS